MAVYVKLQHHGTEEWVPNQFVIIRLRRIYVGMLLCISSTTKVQQKYNGTKIFYSTYRFIAIVEKPIKPVLW